MESAEYKEWMAKKVERPPHYTENRKYEPINVIEDWELGFCLGNALKYISRAGRKDDEIEDLEKAMWYIRKHIDQVKTKRQARCVVSNDSIRKLIVQNPANHVRHTSIDPRTF